MYKRKIQTLLSGDPQIDRYFGAYVAINDNYAIVGDLMEDVSGNSFVVGAQWHNSNGNEKPGAAYIYSPASHSAENEITSFQIPEQTGVTIIDEDLHTVLVEAPEETNVTALTPEIAASENATINPESGTAQDFTQPFVYTVTAQNGDQQEWTVTVDILTGIISAHSNGFNIYPNPSNGVFTIENLTGFHPDNYRDWLGLEVTDITGKVILTIQAQEHAPVPLSLQIDISATTGHAPLPGIYFIKIITENSIFTEKFIIQ